MKHALTDILKPGAENAIRADELCIILGIDSRSLSREVQRARLDGIPVCCTNTSEHAGYFLGDKAAVQRCCRQLERRAKSALRTRQALKYSLVPDNQISFLENEQI